jgi:WD40 repeat protein
MFSPDGKAIFTVSRSEARIWDLITGAVLRRFEAPEGEGVLAFVPDGRAVLTGDDYQPAKLWDVATGKKLSVISGLKGNGWLNLGRTSFSISPDGRTLLTGGEGIVRLWDLSTGRELKRTDTKGRRGPVGFTPDGLRFFAVDAISRPASVRIWETATGRIVREIQNDVASQLAFSRDNATLLINGNLFDVESGRKTIGYAEPGYPSSLGIFSADEKSVFTADYHGVAHQWDSDGRKLRRFGGDRSAILAVAISPDGQRFFSGQGEFVHVWDAVTGRQVARWKEAADVRAIAVSTDGRKLLSGGEAGAALFDAEGSLLRRFTSTSVNTIRFSPDQHMVVAGGSNGRTYIWDSLSGDEIRHLERASSMHVSSIAISVDGQLILGGDEEQNLLIWEALSGKKIRTVQIPRQDPSRTDLGELSVAFAPQGKLFASGGVDGYLRVWDPRKERVLHRLDGHYGPVLSIGFFTNGRLLVSGGDDQLARIWDVTAGRELKRLLGHSGSVTSVLPAPNGKVVLTGSKDGTLRLWDVASGRQLISMMSFSDGSWVTITPEGFFDSSSMKAAQALTVVRGLEAYSVDQFYDQLYRPDLVREKLAGDPSGKVKEAAAKLDLTKAVASGGSPRVRVVAPVSGSQVQGDQVTVEAEITDRGGGIGKVEWRVNGVTLGVEERGIKRTDEGAANAIKVSRTLGLTPGENRIAVLAYNEAGLIASEAAEITVTSVQETATKLRLYVLAVGVNDYWDSALKLNYAAQDAKTLSDGLKQAGSKLYEQVEVRTVLDAEATAEKLEGVFTELGKKVRPQDVFVFFLAGHGKTVDARFYFLPQDFRYAGEDSITKKAVGQNQLQEWVSRIKAQKSVLLFDACESGSLVGDKIAMRGIEEKTAIDRMTRAMGRTVLTATTDSKPAIEGYRGHGVFTYTLLAAFGAADANADGVIDVTELATYVDRRLPDLTYDAFRLRQVPQMSIVGSNFPLASKISLLHAEGSAPPFVATSTPTKPTHVVIASTQVRQSAAATGVAIVELPAGAQVTIVKRESGWIIVARDGKQLGYVQQEALAPLQ